MQADFTSEWRVIFTGALCLRASVGVCVVGLLLGGCGGEIAADPQRPWGNAASSSGVYWTIRCMELQGAGCAADADRVAETLRNTRGIKPRQVFVQHEPRRSVVYYGKYLRTPEGNTGKFDIPKDMQADAALIKTLTTNEGGRFFFDSRPVPVPTPDPGPPEWALRNCPGTYSLRIAIFFDEPGFYQRKDAAVAYCQELRQKGYDAWYRHSEFVSEVFVGTFGPEARVRGRKSGVVAFLNGPEVQKLQLKEQGRFQYELWNMKMRSQNALPDRRASRSAGADADSRKRVVYLSRLFPVRDELSADEIESYRY